MATSELPSLDDNIDTMIDGRLEAFQDKLPKTNLDEEVSGNGASENGKSSREELLMRLKQKRMFYGGRRMSKSAQKLKLEDAKRKYQEKQKKEVEAEQAKVISSESNLEKNRQRRARRKAKKAKKAARASQKDE